MVSFGRAGEDFNLANLDPQTPGLQLFSSVNHLHR